MKLKRDFFRRNEGDLTVLQIVGFLILLLGISALMISAFIKSDVTASVIAISFFVTMLGFSFAFPSLLEGSEGLSTMRIIVFMITNVICMLLLKIGWADGITSLENIKLDQYWMGVIAFVFGAKAVQSFFESRMAVPNVAPKEALRTGMATVEFTHAEIAKLGVAQNEQFLKVKFPNIASVSDTVGDLDQKESHVIALYLNDNNTAGIPDRLEVKMPDGTRKTIATEIVKGVGSGGIHINQKDEIRIGRSHGSVCCIVDTSDGVKVVTAGHVFSEGESTNYGGELDISDQSPAQINKSVIGNWFFQIINYKNDVALSSIDNLQLDPALISFKGKGHYEVSDKDIRKTRVKVISNIFEPKERFAFILDYNTAWDVQYSNKKLTKNNIIVIGSASDRNQSGTVSEGGDSGGCVYEPVSGDLVGLILGGNGSFTWVLPLKEIFETFDYKLS